MDVSRSIRRAERSTPANIDGFRELAAIHSGICCLRFDQLRGVPDKPDICIGGGGKLASKCMEEPFNLGWKLIKTAVLQRSMAIVMTQ